MSASTDDLALEVIVVNELKVGVAAIERDGFGAATTRADRHPRTDDMMFEIGGRFSACPDRDVYRRWISILVAWGGGSKRPSGSIRTQTTIPAR